nr:hypothetical protein [uncultured Allomuricauda sp.]
MKLKTVISINCLMICSLSSYGQDVSIDTLTTYQDNGSKNLEVMVVDGRKEGNGYMYNRDNEIVGFKHFQNDTLNGYGLSLFESTKTPKYIFEFNKGKLNGVIIGFYENGRIKHFRSSDIYSESQKMEFHENGVIKAIGKTKKGGHAHGTWFYFDKNGMLERTAEYENGEPIKEED